MEVDLAGRRLSEAAASHGFGVEIPPFHAEVFGRFWSFLAFLSK